MIKLIQSLKGFFTLSLLLCSLISCGDDDDNTPVLDITQFTSEVTNVEDIGNAGDASDISVTFSQPIASADISEYRVFYEKAGSANLINAMDLSLLSSDSYTSVSGVIQTTLKAEQLSIQGENLDEDVDYQIFILSIGTFNGETIFALSAASATFQVVDTEVLNIEDFTVEITAAVDEDNDDNASDFLIDFNSATSSSVQEYRLIASLNSLSVEGAQDLSSDSYTVVTADGSNSHSANLNTEQKDAEGNDIVSGNTYQLTVLTVGTFKDEPVFAISNSEEVEMVLKPETSTLIANFKGNDAISIDAAGNLYIANYGSYVDAGGGVGGGNGTAALKVSPSGEVTEFSSNLSGPIGSAVDADGNFFTNNGNDNSSADLTKIAPDGAQSTIATLSGYPSGILIGNDGNYYVANYLLPVINIVTPDGVVTEFVSDELVRGGVGIVYDDDENILVGNFTTGDVLLITPAGDISVIGTVPTTATGFVIGYITYFEGNVYATGYGSNTIYRVSISDGEVIEMVGNGTYASVDGEFESSSFITPNGIAVDKNRRLLYVSENGNGGGLRVIPLD